MEHPGIERLLDELAKLGTAWWKLVVNAARNDESDPALLDAARAADRLENEHGRGREGYLARRRLTDVVASACPEDASSVDVDSVESGLSRVATAVVVRDLLTEDQWQVLTRPVSDVVDSSRFVESPLEMLRFRIPLPFSYFLNRLVNELGADDLAIVLRRQGRTLQQVGDELGITREWVRQVQARAQRVLMEILDERTPEIRDNWTGRLRASFAASERELFDGLIAPGPNAESERELARIVLTQLAAGPPEVLGTLRILGWWTLNPNGLLDAAEQLEALLPCHDEDMQSALDQFSQDEAGALRLALERGGTSIRFHSGANCWVRARARDRDAAWLMLNDAAEPLALLDLALLVGTPPRALGEALRRDDRFVQLRPSGRWSVVEWNVTESVHRSTLEATITVLTELGPLRWGRLLKEVKAIYPVSDAAVQQCLSHYLIGRWPDRTIDLVERGAPPIIRREPEKTRDVQVQAGVVHLRRLVDHDLLRGSGLGVPGYLTWALGLIVAPSARTFHVGSLGRISVKYAIQGSTVSSLKTFADKLGAQEGCRLVISLSLSDDDAASITLACDDHDHTGSLP